MPLPVSFASALTLSAVAYACKAFVSLGTKRFDVTGLPILLDALKPPPGEAKRTRGVVTGASTQGSTCALRSTVCKPQLGPR